MPCAPQGLDPWVPQATTVEHKNKKGRAYAAGKHLIVFSDPIGQWRPSRAARKIAGNHSFKSVWVLHLGKGDADRHTYSVSVLDATEVQAPIWKILIDGQFTSWQIQRIL